MPMLAAPKWSGTSAPKKVKSVLLSLSLPLFLPLFCLFMTSVTTGYLVLPRSSCLVQPFTDNQVTAEPL